MTEISLYVLLVFDGRYLFIPQHEVESVEIISDVKLIDTSEGVVGWFYGHGLESPVYSLNDNLSLLLEIPKKRDYLVLLKANPQPIGIICDEVESINLQKELLQPQELHVVMKTPTSPIRQLLRYQDKIACICSGTALVKYLSHISKQLLNSEDGVL
ncbi:MAG: hypothetical protein KAH77_11300 [Thiomargarita sp.]|nr:hypothetical protein [Thiomargarita sp.]